MDTATVSRQALAQMRTPNGSAEIDAAVDRVTVKQALEVACKAQETAAKLQAQEAAVKDELAIALKALAEKTQ